MYVIKKVALIGTATPTVLGILPDEIKDRNQPHANVGYAAYT